MVDPVDIGTQEIDEYAEEMQSRREYQLRQELLEQQQRQAQRSEAELAGARSVQNRRGVGRFIIPSQNTWMAHRSLVKDPGLSLHYYSEHYPYFDDIIHQRINYAPVWDVKDSRYEGYDVLRENLAVLRNYIMSEFFKDGSVDANDMGKVKHMAQIAEFLVDGLNNDRFLANPLAPKIRTNKANLPGSGVQYLYKKILARQRSYQWWYPVLRPWYFITGKTWKDWNLPPLEQSPFSDEALRQPPPQREAKGEDMDIDTPGGSISKDSRDPRSQAPEVAASAAAATAIDDIAEDFTHAGQTLSGVETLQEPTRRESIDIAKDILNKLKIMMGGSLIEHGLSPSATHNSTILDALKGAVRIYESALHKLHAVDTEIMANPAVQAANNAIGTLGYVAKLEVLRVAEQTGDHAMVSKVQEQIASMPDAWKEIKGKSFGQLFDTLESGINTVVVRMQQLADRDTSTRYWLGFSNANALGGADPALQQSDDELSKAMTSDDYYRQFNAQKAQRRQMVASQVASRQRQQMDDEQHHAGPNASARQQAQQQRSGGKDQKATKNTSLSGLIAKDQVASMRQSLATTPGAESVKISRRNDILRRQEQRRRSTLRNVEVLNRVNNRVAELQDPSEPPEPSGPNTPQRKPGHSHGI